MKGDVSNNVLAFLVIAAIAVSAATTMTMMSVLQAPPSVTGFAATTQQTGQTTVTLQSEVAIKLMVTTVAFGNIGVGELDDTTDSDPGPFQLKNNGSVCVNISMGATNLWNTTSPAPDGNSSYWIYNGTYNQTCDYDWMQDSDQVNITSMDGTDPTNANLVQNLSYKSANGNIMLVNLWIEVPPDETPTAKHAFVYFKAVTEAGC